MKGCAAKERPMRQIVCPACRAANRTPDGRDPRDARCGKCRAHLFTGQPVEVDGPGLDRHRNGNLGTAVLVDVWAPWCGPCRTMAPQFEAAAAQLEPGVRLLKLDAEAHPEAAATLRVSGIPALILWRDGREIARRAGASDAAGISRWVREALARAPATH
jgi:thioredoxin 2